MTGIDFVTIQKFSELSGFSTTSIRSYIKREIWPKGLVWVKADGRILIRLSGFKEHIAKASKTKQSKRCKKPRYSPFGLKHKQTN